MGPTHAASGAAAGLLLAITLPPEYGGAGSYSAALVFGGVAAGAALLPDLDHHNSTATNSLGPVTQIVHKALYYTSIFIEENTGTKRDSSTDQGHRGATHTLAFAIAGGIGVGAAVNASVWGAVITVYICGFLAVLGLGGDARTRYPLLPFAAPAVAAVAVYQLPTLSGAWGLGMAVTVGLVMHNLGDMITPQGAPLFAPFAVICGRRWWNVRLPSMLRISANGMGNQVLMTVFSLVTMFLLVATMPTGLHALLPDIAPHHNSQAWSWW